MSVYDENCRCDLKTRQAESRLLPGNILKNLSRILKNRPLKNLKNAFRSTPGFIIPADPSLDKNVLYLKQVKDRGILIALDTALKPLLKHSLQPHFTISRDPSHKNYLHLLGSETQLQHFIVAETGVASQTFVDFPDKIFTFSTGSPLVRILEAHSEPLGELEAWWGPVIRMALDFAVYIGLDPIIFAGQDSAFTGTRSVSESRDRSGDNIHTSHRRELDKNGLARLLRKYPQVRFINTGEEGIFPGIPHLPLYQAINTFVDGRRPVELNRLRQIPTLNKRDNINRLLTFLSQGSEFFGAYLEKVQEVLGLLETDTGLSPAGALPLLRQSEEVREHLYAEPRYGEILEMWSGSSICYFLREYNRLRNRPLDETAIRENFSLYERYFRHIKPLLEDMITHFKLAAGELLELESSSSCGSWLIRCREGAAPTFATQNPYMFEAAEMRGLLYTLPEIEREFPRLFEKPAQPLVLEVGCYLGHTVIEMARHNPGLNVLGLDIKYKRVVKSARKIQRARLSNAKIALCDVMELLPVLPESSLYGMFIFFPDPWIKERHEKYRYLNEDFFQLALSRLSTEGFIWLKTDRETYFAAITAAAKQYGFSVSGSLPGKIHQRPYRTLFEEIFTRKKIPYYQAILSRYHHRPPGLTSL
jgi:tRNA (guanine-N7-)-methyltransferase